jgi:hypothetical protein
VRPIVIWRLHSVDCFKGGQVAGRGGFAYPAASDRGISQPVACSLRGKSYLVIGEAARHGLGRRPGLLVCQPIRDLFGVASTKPVYLRNLWRPTRIDAERYHLSSHRGLPSALRTTAPSGSRTGLRSRVTLSGLPAARHAADASLLRSSTSS